MLPENLSRFKKEGRVITILTAWDSISAAIVEQAGADVVLVGDSLSMVVLGHQSTLPVTIDQMIHHTQAVGRGFTKRPEAQPLVICDLPFLSYQCGEDKAVAAAGSILKNSCASAVKVEGAQLEVLEVIKRLVRMGIPVMGHLGLTPQSINQQGYKLQAIDSKSQHKLLEDAESLELAGCFSLVLEHVPSDIARLTTEKLQIPVIGIGAGDQCDGQVRVTADLLGLSNKQPPFSQPLIAGRELFVKALETWISEKKNP